MLPISGTFEQFKEKVQENHDLCEGNTIGLLFVDSRQNDVRQYLTNYLDVFNTESGKYLDFCIPGYSSSKIQTSDNCIQIKNDFWFFNHNNYTSFQKEMKLNYNVPFSTTAYLLLLEIGDPGSFKRTIKIELDKNKDDVRNAGDLFQQLFEFTREKIAFEEIRNWIIRNKRFKFVKENIFGITQEVFNLGISCL